MTAPTIDVIINNYNYGRFLGAAIDSALHQTYPKVRVIVVDDGSTDDSPDVIAEYGERVVPVVRAHNRGQAAAFNAGFAKSQADVVIFLDADDMLMPYTAARLADTICGDRCLAKVQYRLEVIDAAGRPTGVLKPAAHLAMPSGDVRDQELLFPFDLTWVATSGNGFARWVLCELFPVPEDEFVHSADWYLKHLAALYGPVRSHPWVGARYRIHGQNGYEPSSSELDLRRVRQSIVFAAATTRHLVRAASGLGMDPPCEVLSVADLANRLISLRIDPGAHPTSSDSVLRLVRDGWCAAWRRSDVSPAMRLLFAAWFAAAAMAPRVLTRRLATLFLFPDRRGRVNNLLSRLHRPRTAA